MADRLTQLQEAVNTLAELFCNSIGVIQEKATPSTFSGFERLGGRPSPAPQPEGAEHEPDYPTAFANQIAAVTRDIDFLIDSLPSEDSSLEAQMRSLNRLQAENEEAGRELEREVAAGEALLEQIQEAMQDIAKMQLQCQALESDLVDP